MGERDVYSNPEAGDAVEAKGIELYVHLVKDGQVYMGRRTPREETCGLQRCTVEVWRDACALYAPKILQRAEVKRAE